MNNDDKSLSLVFLCSAGGGNLRFLHRLLQEGAVQRLEIRQVIADRDCQAIAYAKAQGLSHRVVEYTEADRESLRQALLDASPDLIITTFNRILDDKLVQSFQGKMLNVHYSMLPLYGGTINTQPVKQALAAGCKFIGTTCHFVEETVDAGEIVSQTAIPVVDNQSFDDLMNRVFQSGCLNLLNALDHLSEQGVVMPSIGRNPKHPSASDIAFSPPASFDPEEIPSSFWEAIK